MWYFTWILGLGLALAFGIRNEAQTRARFEQAKEQESGGA